GDCWALYVDNSACIDSLFYLLTDNQGSVNVITNSSGGKLMEYNFDPWGRRRNPADWSYNSVPGAYITTRGYTMHEHMDAFKLINMNGRVYDPVLGHFLSPDPYVQNPTVSQCFNRYGYCLFNPLKYVDPSGYYIRWLPEYRPEASRLQDKHNYMIETFWYFSYTETDWYTYYFTYNMEGPPTLHIKYSGSTISDIDLIFYQLITPVFYDNYWSGMSGGSSGLSPLQPQQARLPVPVAPTIEASSNGSIKLQGGRNFSMPTSLTQKINQHPPIQLDFGIAKLTFESFHQTTITSTKTSVTINTLITDKFFSRQQIRYSVPNLTVNGFVQGFDIRISLGKYSMSYGWQYGYNSIGYGLINTIGYGINNGGIISCQTMKGESSIKTLLIPLGIIVSFYLPGFSSILQTTY
ncbi:MAG: hypothetical protein JW973_06970, partial [Bacteroidales bacterium]|nr:hypothetical protein [Bacteroidales bacterium]